MLANSVRGSRVFGFLFRLLFQPRDTAELSSSSFFATLWVDNSLLVHGVVGGTRMGDSVEVLQVDATRCNGWAVDMERNSSSLDGSNTVESQIIGDV